MPANVTWDKAFSATDLTLIRAEGLAHAVLILVNAHPALSGPDVETAALREVAEALTCTQGDLRNLRSAEYSAGFAALRAGEARA